MEQCLNQVKDLKIKNENYAINLARSDLKLKNAENYGSSQKNKNLRLKKDLADTRKNNQILKNRLSKNANADFMSNQNELDQLQKELEARKQKIVQLQTELLASNKNNTEIQSKFETSMKKNLKLETDISKNKVDIQNLKKELEAGKQKIVLLQTELLASNNKNTEIQSKFETSMTKNLKLESDINKNKADIQNLQYQLNYERKEKNTLVDTFSNVLASSQTFEDKLVICEQDLGIERESNNQLKLKEKKLKDEIISAQKNLSQVEEINAVLKNKLTICSNSGKKSRCKAIK